MNLEFSYEFANLTREDARAARAADRRRRERERVALRQESARSVQNLKNKRPMTSQSFFDTF